jgi:NAD(P)-dependent dehydrogenase (short-subunit alcohol dehydrogenase family)
MDMDVKQTARTSVLDRFRLDGLTAVITGAGPGIGAHVAHAFAEMGAKVVLSARSGDRIGALAEEIRDLGGQALSVVADVSRKDDLERLADASEQAFGPVHILLNNAAFGAISIDSEPFAGDDDVWEMAVAVNLMAPYRLAKRFTPGMKAAGYGSIINVLTCAAFHPIQPQMAYGSTKAGLHMLTRYIARGAAPEVRANCICPGSMSPTGETKPAFAEHVAKNAIPRAGRSDEVTGAALLLASPASSYTTGQVIFCEGGRINTLY